MSKYEAKDSFHLSGYGQFRKGTEIPSDMPEPAVKELLKAGLVGEAADKKGGKSTNPPSNKMIDTSKNENKTGDTNTPQDEAAKADRLKAEANTAAAGAGATNTQPPTILTNAQKKELAKAAAAAQKAGQ